MKTPLRARRHARIRAKVSGTSTRPRLAVFRSNRFIFAQIIDDINRVTLAAATSKGSKEKSARDRAKAVGVQIAKAAKAKQIDAVVFDRAGFIYTGSIQALAEGAREGGLKF